MKHFQNLLAYKEGNIKYAQNKLKNKLKKLLEFKIKTDNTLN